ncbi:putative PPPDE peptidase domain [Monocercomonoides exilis]|uniref:putative PPPDE peptidase domain n=1 Tax=Monocercomonoides exilis TaxID=2049356 RepID=UPI00355952E2|nr:putative PPPDE peptidase domain [Monocercomonoides exilis]|eukprot:MONOS_9476.1-p1 / transcript=MONOS_9476.1 / gene=MONOS_9476 / organism=Monocercomonoides_exilis_PA203 / gene_product=unspecified product / transcript_product=unspecified product / location=Mono_scaffold00393:16887-17428(-) / protein_length=80 / sequence_SO=supercontig / SO=protein_coding / is_pseudo=false
MSSFDVQIYLYDLSHGMVRSMSAMLIGKTLEGLWHTGIVVYGKEYYYSGGIQRGVLQLVHRRKLFQWGRRRYRKMCLSSS